MTIEEIKQHRFFTDINWDDVRKRCLEPVPFVPERYKYHHLLQNEYKSLKNTDDPSTRASSVSPKRGSLLGDFTLYRVNKEFEDF